MRVLRYRRCGRQNVHHSVPEADEARIGEHIYQLARDGLVAEGQGRRPANIARHETRQHKLVGAAGESLAGLARQGDAKAARPQAVGVEQQAGTPRARPQPHAQETQRGHIEIQAEPDGAFIAKPDQLDRHLDRARSSHNARHNPHHPEIGGDCQRGRLTGDGPSAIAYHCSITASLGDGNIRQHQHGVGSLRQIRAIKLPLVAQRRAAARRHHQIHRLTR